MEPPSERRYGHYAMPVRSPGGPRSSPPRSHLTRTDSLAFELAPAPFDFFSDHLGFAQTSPDGRAKYVPSEPVQDRVAGQVLSAASASGVLVMRAVAFDVEAPVPIPDCEVELVALDQDLGFD